MKYLKLFENSTNPDYDRCVEYFKEKMDWRTVNYIQYILTKYEDVGVAVSIKAIVTIPKTELRIYDITNGRYFTWDEENFQSLKGDLDILGFGYNIYLIDENNLIDYYDFVILCQDIIDKFKDKFEVVKVYDAIYGVRIINMMKK